MDKSVSPFNKYRKVLENGEMLRNKKLFKSIVLGIAKALKTLQSKGVMHRDIKPDTINTKGKASSAVIIIFYRLYEGLPQIKVF